MYSCVLGLAFLCGLTLFALLVRFSSSRVRPAYTELERAFAQHVFRQSDATKGIQTVKVVGAEQPLGGRLARVLRTCRAGLTAPT